MNMKTVLGIELGSTRIKAAALDESFRTVSAGGYTWESRLENGVWTYSLDEAWRGIRQALAGIESRDSVQCVGISGMMHGYLAFDSDWKLLTPFRTWQNTMTAEAASALTKLFGYNVPQRWSVAHLYQAVLNGEEHIKKVAHITTLAGYVHYMLTGKNVLGVGDASGMFPIDSAARDYDEGMIEKFNRLTAERGMPWRIRDLLPKALVAGEDAGSLTNDGSAMLNGLLKPGIPFAPPEGDAETGMTATNAVAPRTGNVSAGTSIFAMVVLERPLSRVYEEIDIVMTPSGRPVAMVHCNNGTNDTNAWAAILKEAAELFGARPDAGELYTALYKKALEGEPDCGGVTVCNYMAGEGVTHLDEGRPMVIRAPGCRFTLANFFRAQLYAAMATLKIGMEILEKEKVAIDLMTGHGGLFKTPIVGQRFMAAACGAPITCMESAGEGGPFGMALLAAFRMYRKEGEQLEDYLNSGVYADARGVTIQPDPVDAAGFNEYMRSFRAMLDVERLAAERM